MNQCVDCVTTVTWCKMALFIRVPLCVFACILMVGISGLSVRRVVEDLFKVTPSKLSRFHVLHEWKEAGETYATPTDGGDFPAAHTSDVMLQTLGILKGFTWPGVNVGNVFKRPKASVLFVVDGLTEETPLSELSTEKTLSVDQSGLAGDCVSDATAMFGGANDMHTQLAKLFGWDKSLTAMVSADEKVARSSDRLHLEYSATDSGYFVSNMEDINNKYCQDLVCISRDGTFRLSDTKDTAFSVHTREELDFLREMLMSMELPEKIPQAKARDGYPDAFQFAYSSIESLVMKYGKDSDKVAAAVKGVRKVVDKTLLEMGDQLVDSKVTNNLIDRYEGAVVVQSLTLVWNRVSPDRVNEIVKKALVKADTVLPMPVDSYSEKDLSSADLEQMPLSSRYKFCTALTQVLLEMDLVTLFHWDSCFGSYPHARSKRSTYNRYRTNPSRFTNEDGDTAQLLNASLAEGLAFERTENFSAMTAIFTVLVVFVVLVIFGLAWVIFTMDPAKDTVVYRLMPGRVKTE